MGGPMETIDGVETGNTVVPNRCAASVAEAESVAWNRRSSLPQAAQARVKRSSIVSQIALWADDEGLELSLGQGDDLAGRILCAFRETPVIDLDYLRETLAWVRRNLEEQPKLARDQIDFCLGRIVAAKENRNA